MRSHFWFSQYRLLVCLFVPTSGMTSCQYLTSRSRGFILSALYSSCFSTNRRYRVILLVVVILGLVLRVFHLGSGALWYDEAFSALIAERALGDMIRATAHDVHPPLYYFILWCWFRAWPGSDRPTEWWLRVPSLIFSTLAIPLTYYFACNLERRVALIAAFLMSVLPFQILYAQEVRQYSLLMLMSLLAATALQRKLWKVFSIALTACAYTHNLGLIYACVLVLISLILNLNRRHVVIAFAVAAALYIPWLSCLIVQLRQWGSAGYWLPPITLGGILYPLHALLWGTHTTDALAFPGMFLSAFLAFTGISVLRNWPAPRKAFLVLALAFAYPLLVALISCLKQSIYLPRGLIIITPAYYVVIALALRHSRVLRTLFTLTLVVSLWGYYFDPRLQKWDHKLYSSIIKDNFHSGDVVLCASKCLPFIWYLPDRPIYTLPTPPDDRLHCILTPNTLRSLGIAEVMPNEITGKYRRMWFVWTLDPSTTPSQLMIRDQLLSRYPILREWQFLWSRLAQGTITLLELTGGQTGSRRP